MGCTAAGGGAKYKETVGDDAPSECLPFEHGFRFGAFMAHCEAGTTADAFLIKTELEERLEMPIFFENDDTQDFPVLGLQIRRRFRDLEDGVRESKVVLLLQSLGCSCVQNPSCLVELLAAVNMKRPIVGISLGGYSSERANELLRNLDTQLRQLSPKAADLLLQHGVNLAQAAYKLSTTLPHIPSVELNTSASRVGLDAMLRKLVDVIRAAVPVQPALDFEQWLIDRQAYTVSKG